MRDSRSVPVPRAVERSRNPGSGLACPSPDSGRVAGRTSGIYCRFRTSPSRKEHCLALYDARRRKKFPQQPRRTLPRWSLLFACGRVKR
jgi:hypothetical protein